MRPLRVACWPKNGNRISSALIKQAIGDIGGQTSFIQTYGDADVDLLLLEPTMREWTWLDILIKTRRETPDVPVILFTPGMKGSIGEFVLPSDDTVYLFSDLEALKKHLGEVLASTRAARKRVLFVDDDINVLQAYQRFLHKTPWDIVTVNSAEVAMNVLGRERVDLIVTDIKMPGIHGLNLFSKVREKSRDVPIIVCSGYPGMREDYDLHLYNVAAFIEKPIKIVRLKQTIRAILD